MTDAELMAALAAVESELEERWDASEADRRSELLTAVESVALARRLAFVQLGEQDPRTMEQEPEPGSLRAMSPAARRRRPARVRRTIAIEIPGHVAQALGLDEDEEDLDEEDLDEDEEDLEEDRALCDVCHREPVSDEAVLSGLCEGCALDWVASQPEDPLDGAASPIAQQLAADATRCRAAGIPFNPTLPPHFDNTPNERRPPLHQRWWNRPYVSTYTVERWDAHYATLAEEPRARWTESGRAEWMQAWPLGIRYDVRCLDGGAWDRSTAWGQFATLDDALECVAAGPTWLRGKAPDGR